MSGARQDKSHDGGGYRGCRADVGTVGFLAAAEHSDRRPPVKGERRSVPV